MTLSTHVLDATAGRPAVGVGVLLETFSGGGWTEVATGVTDDDGRLTDWLPPDRPGIGTHRLLFDTGAYFARAGVPSFYPAATLTFLNPSGYRLPHLDPLPIHVAVECLGVS